MCVARARPVACLLQLLCEVAGEPDSRTRNENNKLAFRLVCCVPGARKTVFHAACRYKGLLTQPPFFLDLLWVVRPAHAFKALAAHNAPITLKSEQESDEKLVAAIYSKKK